MRKRKNTAMEYDEIILEVHAGVARITLNRPEKLNSFTLKMLNELNAALTRLNSNRDTRLVVITGAGRAFCAGQDLGALADTIGKEVKDLGELVRNYYCPIVRQIVSARFPIVAAVNGVAAGAGANLALACDVVVASESAKFIEAFSKLNLVPDTGGTYFLPKLIGRARAMGCAFLSVPIDAKQAEEWGMIWKCYAADQFIAGIEEIIQQLLRPGTLGLARTKEAFNASYKNDLDTQLTLEATLITELSSTIEFEKATQAFLGKSN